MNFITFRDAINNQFSEMANHDLFRTAVDKDHMWETYLKSFPEGTNKIFRERTKHDCQCCKQFIRACGDVVSISDDLELISIWDVNVKDEYQVVAKAMSKLVKSRMIKDQFLHWEKNIGAKENIDKDLRVWDHFYFDLPNKFANKINVDTILSNTRSDAQVFSRGLHEITLESLETVLELIDQDSIYRGEEHKTAIVDFRKLKKNCPENPLIESFYAWKNSTKSGARIKNTVIGTLLIDVSEGMDLDYAVSKFESKVAPTNYKRPTAIISKGMIKKAQEKIESLGFVESLPRRNAVMDDLTINNVLFANRKVKKVMDVFDEMSAETEEASLKRKTLEKMETVSIETFIDNILPKIDKVEIMFENKHENNLMSLVAPVNEDAPGMFKWGNNFSWAYKGEVADSIKERVKKAGGNVNAVLRCSLAWNNFDDLDIHIVEPNKNEIYFGNKRGFYSTGSLDIDMNAGGSNSREAVENITWTDKKKMGEGIYEVWVHQFTQRETKDIGFTVEIEYEGKILTFHYLKTMKTKDKVQVARFTFNKTEGIRIIESLDSTESTKTTWNIKTQQFHDVKMIMNSPNHWDGEKTGNKHYFFILENCHSGEATRGFFNEFLNEKLTEHRKVFEVLGSKMKTDANSDQLSGVGFSSTKKDTLICKVSGSFTRMLKVTF